MSGSKPIDVSRPNSGVLFQDKNDPSSHHGALNVEGAEYDLVVAMTTSQGGKDMYKVTGTARQGSEIMNGFLFIEEEKPSSNENAGARPNFTGHLTGKNEGFKYRLAAWNKVSGSGVPFISLSIERPRGKAES